MKLNVDLSKLKKKKGGDEGQGATASSAPAARAKKDRFVLFLGDDGAILVFVQDGKVVRRMYAPSAEKEHLTTLVELMKEHAKVPVYVLVDMIDQSYVRHTLPPVSPLSVNKLVQRRLERDFTPEDIKGALSLGRDTGARKEWNFLLISLGNSSQLQQWTSALFELPNRFMGVYLVPVEAQSMIMDMANHYIDEGNRSEWKILVSHDKVSGFRQVVLKDGQLIFTRLTQSTSETSPEVTAGNIEQEVLNTIEYLRRLSYTEQSGLDLFVIAAQDIIEKVDGQRLGAKNAHLLTPFEVSQSLNLGQAALSGDRFGDVVLASSFGVKKKHELKLLPAYAKKLELMYNSELGIKALAACIVLYLLYSIGVTFVDIFSAKSDIEEYTEKAAKARSQLSMLEADIEAMGEDRTAVMNAAMLYIASDAGARDPMEFLKTFASVLKNGELVKSFEWREEKLPAPKNNVSRPANKGAVTEVEDKPFFVNVEIEFLNHGGQRDTLVANSKQFLQRMEKAFAGFEITHKGLPGDKSGSENLILNFDDPSLADNTIKEGENILKLSLKGPMPEKTDNNS